MMPQDPFAQPWQAICRPVTAIPGVSSVELCRRQGFPLQRLVRSIVLRDASGFVLALYPADSRISLSQVRASSGRHMEFAARAEYQPLLERGPLPGLPGGVTTLIDNRLLGGDSVMIENEDDGGLLELPADALLRLLHDCRCADIAEPLDLALPSLAGVSSRPSLGDLLEERLAGLRLPTELEALLHCDPEHLRSEDLVSRLARLPDLASTLVQLARIPLLGGDPGVLTLTAAVQTLGVPVALGWTRGLGIAACFRPRTSGLRGHIGYWRHALYSTALLWQGRGRWQEDDATVIMSGLLHDFGYLLLGYLDPQRFAHFNRLLAEAPERPVQEMELLISGDSHCRLGARLAQLWQLPDAVAIAVCEHHNPSFHGAHQALARGVLVVNRWLKRYGIGDARSAEVAPELLASLGLEPATLQGFMDQLLDNCGVLDPLALQMACLEMIVSR